MNTIATLGEALAVFTSAHLVPLRHETDLRLSIGGAECNFAVGLARLGLAARWLGRVSTDELGERILRELRAEAVDVGAVVRDSTRPTGLLIKERRGQSLTRIHYHRSGSAGSKLSIKDLPDDFFDDVRWLHVTGITPALSASALSTWFHALEQARIRSIPVSFDVNHRAKLWSVTEARDAFKTVLKDCDVVFATEREAELLTGRTGSALEQADWLVRAGAYCAVVKQGSRGVTVRTATGDEGHVHAPKVDVVDDIGAGDAFAAGFISQYVRDADWKLAAEKGVVCASRVVSTMGDWEGALSVTEGQGTSERETDR